MFIVLSVLAFLVTLTVLGVKSSYSIAGEWRAELQNTITVQISPQDTAERTATAQQVKSLLEENDDVQSVTILEDEYSRSLLNPWIGDEPLPDGIVLPILLDVETKADKSESVDALSETLKRAGISATIDNHQSWNAQYGRSVAALQMISVIVLVLVILAILSAMIFATRSIIQNKRKLIDVLHQIGAAPNYTAKVFSVHFAWLGLKAGALGAIAALIALLLFSLLSAGAAGNAQFLPRFSSGPSSLILTLLVPVFMALICAATAWYTVLKTLYREVYP